MCKHNVRHERTTTTHVQQTSGMTQNYHYSATCVDNTHNRASRKSTSIHLTTNPSPHFASTRYRYLHSDLGVVINQRYKSTGLASSTCYVHHSLRPGCILNQPSSQPIILYSVSCILMHIFTLSATVANISLRTVLTSFFRIWHKLDLHHRFFVPSDNINHAPPLRASGPSPL